MEEKRRDSAPLPATTPPAVDAVSAVSKHIEPSIAQTGHSRRRSTGQKRKLSNSNTSGVPSSTTKRPGRERPPLPLPISHNGPCTRARQTPSYLVEATTARDHSIPNDVSHGHEFTRAIAEASAVAEEALNRKYEDLQVLEGLLDTDFDAIRSRDSNVHVVPMHCGWFSWIKVHPLEERMLPSFFNGKTEGRNADIYLEIRNWIMKRYHLNPHKFIELEDLSNLSVGNFDARQEVMEFLDYWGLINFNPILPADPDVSKTDCEGEKSLDSLIERVYCFGAVEMCPLSPKTNIKTPAFRPGLLLEHSVTEQLTTPQGPAVEYHCNFCSADCSRKRYHCQKQADFDLCMECFSNGKFNSDMAPSDFILMEPGEVLGLGSGKWTDQETLLLLEALELYKESWNEIAEHVATKTKAQCMLHFIQMPIEDSFLNSSADHSYIQQSTDIIPTSKGPPETSTIEHPSGSTSSPMDAPKSSSKGPPEAMEEQPSATTPSLMDTSKSEDSGEENNEERDGNKHAVKALKEAFEAVGVFSMNDGKYSFSEAGNPVMTLAAFLVRLVEADFATASVHCSLKSLSTKSPGINLAMRHCFVLEDPPADSVADITNDKDSPKNEGCHEYNSISKPDNDGNMPRDEPQQEDEDESSPKDDATIEHGAESEKEPAKHEERKNDNSLEGEEPKKAEEEDKKADLKERELDDENVRLKRAATAALSAAAVKAKLLARHEEEQIRCLAASVVKKQLLKLETKMGFFSELESVIARVREELERSRQKLYHERAQIIAARLGFQSLSRPHLQNRATTSLPMATAPTPSTSQRPQVAAAALVPASPAKNHPGPSAVHPPSPSIGMK